MYKVISSFLSDFFFLHFPEFPTQLNFYVFKSWNSFKMAKNWGCLP